MKLLKVNNNEARVFDAEIEENDIEWAASVELGGITSGLNAESEILENADFVVFGLDKDCEDKALFNISAREVSLIHVGDESAIFNTMCR